MEKSVPDAALLKITRLTRSITWIGVLGAIAVSTWLAPKVHIPWILIYFSLFVGLSAATPMLIIVVALVRTFRKRKPPVKI